MRLRDGALDPSTQAQGRGLIKRMSSGKVALVTEIAGDGRSYPKDGDNLVVHYEGRWGGKIFDSSYERRTPLRFRVGTGGVVPGFEEALRQISLGERAVCNIPAALAYGAKGFPGLIPPNQDLEITFELLELSPSL